MSKACNICPIVPSGSEECGRYPDFSLQCPGFCVPLDGLGGCATLQV
uniref:Uncharacterized protein n=1 Tax=Arundo donax TaxID=35708 RepID=A0A0A8Y2R1_ARUDO